MVLSSSKSRAIQLRQLAGGTLLVVLLYIVVKLGSTALSVTRDKHLPKPSSTSFLRPIHDSLADADPLVATAAQDQGWVSPLKKRLAGRKDDAPSLARIPVTNSLPSTADLAPSAPLVKAYDDAFNSLSALAASSVGGKGAKGVPGTGISTNEERTVLQEHLDCISSNGEWVLDEDGGREGAGLTVHKHSSVFATCDKRYYKGASEVEGDDGDHAWDVRQSLKYRWVPSSTCFPTDAPPRRPLSRLEFCTLLAHKSTLLVGDVPQYSLHDLILDFTSLAPQNCYGDLYCKEHALCGDILRYGKPDELDGYTPDQRIFNRLPPAPFTPPAAHLAPPVKGKKSPSIGTLLRYRRSDGLRGPQAYTEPEYVNPRTGIREINQKWLADAKRSDVVILSKSPISLPRKGWNVTWDEWFVWETPEEAAVKLVEGAKAMTEEVWLPEMLETLRITRNPKLSPEDILMVYRGGWRMHSDCGAESFPAGVGADNDWYSPGDGPPPHLSSPSLSALIFQPSTSPTSPKVLRPIHTVFHNLQTIFQNHILRTTLLPHFGVPYLDIETPMSVWRSGMVGGSVANPFAYGLVDQTHGHGNGAGLRSPASGDCLRYCLPSPGMGLEEAFLGGLMQIFERGWGGAGAEKGERRRKEWVGEGFNDIRQREKMRGASRGGDEK
ncbi:hypothetical protein MNV49_005566 [Pseudohyphozyma bogoriensis]|nr:hypothetical protein MNV49_005566 [Pseudohyphozyma bogoriensis]